MWELIPLDCEIHAVWNMALSQPALITRQRWRCLASEAARMGAVRKNKAKAGARHDLAAWVDEIL